MNTHTCARTHTDTQTNGYGHSKTHNTQTHTPERSHSHIHTARKTHTLTNDTHTHTHTHTHTCSDVQQWTTTVDLGFQEFYMQPWTYTSEFSQMNMDFLCMCVKFNYYNHGPIRKSIIGHCFYMHVYASCYRMAGL